VNRYGVRGSGDLPQRVGHRAAQKRPQHDHQTRTLQRMANATGNKLAILCETLSCVVRIANGVAAVLPMTF
jgi:hypothetical protein